MYGQQFLISKKAITIHPRTPNMRSLESIVEEFSSNLQVKVREVENSGKSFLFCLAQFSSSDLVNLTTNQSLIEYCSDVILTTTEDSRVFFSLLFYPQQLQAVAAAVVFCLTSEKNDVICFAVSLSSYILYSYLRSYAESKPLLCILFLLQITNRFRSVPSEACICCVPCKV